MKPSNDLDLDRIVIRFSSECGISRYNPYDFFYDADDWSLKDFTKGGFPFKIKGSHPIFILTTGLTACPCSSSQDINSKHHRFINRGSIKKYPDVPKYKTFLIEDKSFPMPNDRFFLNALKYQGRVPVEAIKDPEGNL